MRAAWAVARHLYAALGTLALHCQLSFALSTITTSTSGVTTTDDPAGLPWWVWFTIFSCLVYFGIMCCMPFVVAPWAEGRREARAKQAAVQLTDDEASE
mmetsp:Transcript_45585/g.83468  ORF Transcript_45585/g.83468 Transcript_45585/m.83468 type:complete len:99 (-) Transcript_45585:38-334(-)